MITNRFLYLIAITFFPLLLWGEDASDLFEPTFTNIAVEDGLSNYHITSICQDSLGYLWIGTGRGLNRYDGTSFKKYFFSPDDFLSGIPCDYIDKIVYCNNHIFVNTRRGAVALNQKTDKWVTINSNEGVGDIIALQNRLFIVRDEAVFEYDFEEGKLIQAKFSSSVNTSVFVKSDDDFLWTLSNDFRTLYRFDLESSIMLQIKQDNKSFLYASNAKIINHRIIGQTQNGISIIELSDNKDALNEHSTILNSLKGQSPFSIEKWNENTALIGSVEEGLYIYDTHTCISKHIEKENSLLSSNLINTSFKDRDGNLWVGTFDNGLDVYYKKQHQFNYNTALNIITEGEFINCIVKSDHNDELFFGSKTIGLLSSKSVDRSIINEEIKSLGVTDVMCMLEDSNNKLWIAGGGYDEVLIYDQITGRVLRPQNHTQLNNIEYISELDGEVYMVSKYHGIFIYTLDGQFTNHIAGSIPGLNQLLLIGKDIIFCSEESGLYRYERDNENISHVPLYKNGKVLKWGGAICMKQESDSVLWIGTMSWGLIKVNLNNFESEMYTTDDGLPCNDVTSIEIDNNGYLWLSTSYGISRMYEEGEFNIFSSREGIGNIQFHRRSSFFSDDGTIYFGGNDGLSYFKPDEIEINRKMEKKPILVRLDVQNIEVQSGDDLKILTHTLPFTKEIKITYHFKEFSINYAVPEFSDNDQLLYAFKLEGWDDDWYGVNHLQRASYSNLPSGKYTFGVKVARSAGSWSDVTELTIRIKPAPWVTWWAILSYFSIITALIYLFLSLRFRNKIALKSLELEKSEHRREKEMGEMKLRFFTNISHELRTPLSMVYDIASVQQQNLTTSEGIAQFQSSIKIHIGRLKRLVDQLLTFRKLEGDTLKVKNIPTDLYQTIDAIVSTINYNAKQRNINLFFEYNLEAEHYVIDRDKVEKILYNLLDNALKYTQKDGSIILNVDQISGDDAKKVFADSIKVDNQHQSFILFEVTDNGVGIASRDIPHIFDLYFKASNKTDYSGTGIGLNFVKRLVDMQEGGIKAESTKGSGATFFVSLPMRELEIPFETQEIAGKEKELKDMDLQVPVFDIPEEFKEKKILIVEDDIALNTYLKNTFEKHFIVYHAFDSDEALSIVKNKFPDLIISDVMMREEDEGLKFCERIKDDNLLSHIPIILLTAKAEDIQIDEGLLKGADIYVTKPFSMQLLTSQIVSLLKNRIRLQRHLFKNDLGEKSPKNDYNTQDLSFIKKVNAIIAKEYKDPEFNVVILSQDMAINRTGFYQKFTQITKFSPSDYLRRYRIEKAIDLMSDNRTSISDIGDEVGFSSRSGFFHAFKKEKGMTPSEFMKRS